MENLKDFWTVAAMQLIFLVFLVFMTVQNIRSNITFWNKYGMILFTIMYLIFFLFFIIIHPKTVPTFEIGIVSIFYIASSAILTRF